MIDNALQVICILSDFLPTWSFKYWKKGVEVFNYRRGFVHSSFWFYRFLPHILWSPVWVIHIKDFYIFLENWPTNHTSFKKDLVVDLEFIIYIFKNGLSPIQIALYYSICSTDTLWPSTVFPIPLSYHLWHYGLHFTNPYVIVIW